MGALKLEVLEENKLRVASRNSLTPQEVSPEKAVAILKKHGTIVTVEQATSILSWLNEFSDIVVAQYLRSK